MQDDGTDTDDEAPIIDDIYRIMQRFEGYAEAWGTYEASNLNQNKGKLEIKATAKTVRGDLSRAQWEAHITGERPLGIIPIRDNNTSLWGCIDVDQYDLDLLEIVNLIKKHGLPLVPCRSKSGGAHLFLFSKDPVAAEIVAARLHEMAALMGYGGSEIFPKQRIVNWDRGDLGSWLNMPYFGGDETDRYAIKENGLGMTLGEFLNAADAAAVDEEFLLQKEFRKRPERDPSFGDGPPCMQHLAATMFPEGGRNEGLFALATFAKKKYGQRWQEYVEKWNREYFDPPLPSAEVQSIIKSHEKKDYNYPCKKQPICGHCNSALCRTRRFGVGGDGEYPVITGLSVLLTEPPLWFIDVEGTRIELSTDELQNYRHFHKACMEQMRVCYRMMKGEDWLRIVSVAMKDAVQMEASDDASRGGQFYELLEDFLMNRHRGEVKEDLLVGRPWLDTETNIHYFRLRDLKKFLDLANFYGYNDAQIVTRIKKYGGDKTFFNIKGKGCNAWHIPHNFTPIPTLTLPELEREPI